MTTCTENPRAARIAVLVSEAKAAESHEMVRPLTKREMRCIESNARMASISIEEATDAYRSLQAYWAGSISACVARDVAAGRVTTVVVK